MNEQPPQSGTQEPSILVSSKSSSRSAIDRGFAGLILFILGFFIVMLSLPGMMQFNIRNAAIASLAIVPLMGGWLMFATRPSKQIVGAAFEKKKWQVIRIGILLIIGLWAVWYVQSQRGGNWLEEDEAERIKAPAWPYRFDEFIGGIPMPVVRDRLSKEGFRMRCYALEKHEQITPLDTHACWTIANNIDGIPSHMIALFFSKDGLRHIRVDFPKDQWPRVESWFKMQSNMDAGTFGSDAGGSNVHGRRGKSGLILVSSPGGLNWAMAMWQSRELLAETGCKNKQYDDRQWQLLCNDWPLPNHTSPFEQRP